jgi:3-isopropylmalate/(R)-2-methylmalate dehydratase small subunit
MESFTRVTGIAAPILRINIDTDQITPGKELVRVHKEGYAASLFAGWRYLGERKPNPEFILNREPWSRAQILLADRNFGCGSSRESAPKALREWGFRAVIAPSFGGIFYNNAFRNGLLPVELPIETVRTLADAIEPDPAASLVTVDLETQEVSALGRLRFPFATPAVLRQMLLQGADEIDLTLKRAVEIEAFRTRDKAVRSWAY